METSRTSVSTPFLAPPLAFPRALPHATGVHAALAAALGLVLLWGVGFAGNGVWHETAHDTRHALGFPCH